MGYITILIYGDPKYYVKVGFVPAENDDIGTVDNEYHKVRQTCELSDGAFHGVSGWFVEDKIFDSNMDDAKEFDKGFEPKEYFEGLPSQITLQEVNALMKSREKRKHRVWNILKQELLREFLKHNLSFDYLFIMKESRGIFAC